MYIYVYARTCGCAGWILAGTGRGIYIGGVGGFVYERGSATGGWLVKNEGKYFSGRVCASM